MTKRVLVYESISGGALGAIATEDTGLLAQGVAMRDALVADLARAVAVACVTGAAAPLPPALAGATAVAPDPSRPAAEFLARAAHDYDKVWAIAPESDGLLAALAAAVGPERWIGCSVSAIRLASSKSATRACLAAHGIDVPAAWRPGEPPPHAESWWVVKPDDGAGTEHTRVHADFAGARSDLAARLAQGLPATMEAWVPGEALSLSLLCTPDGAELLAINHQRIEAAPGALAAYRGVDVRAEAVDGPRGGALAKLAGEVADALPGLSGYVGVDVVWHAHRGPVVIEVNPRLTCAYVGLSAALGRNLAAEILAAAEWEVAADVAC